MPDLTLVCMEWTLSEETGRIWVEEVRETEDLGTDDKQWGEKDDMDIGEVILGWYRRWRNNIRLKR